jgi:hypothetical protein
VVQVIHLYQKGGIMPLEQNVTAPDFTLEDESGNKHT